MKHTAITIAELDDFLRLVEAQRDLTYHLHKFLEFKKQQIEELRQIEMKAQLVCSLKTKFGKDSLKVFKVLTEEEKAEINKLLWKRHIKL